MAEIEGQIVVCLPVETVFDFVADERNEPLYNPGLKNVEQISSGPIGVGTRFRAETASRGRTVEMVIEFTTFERPGRLASHTRMSSMDIRGTLTFEPVPEGTLMRWLWKLEPHGALRLMTPIITRLGRRQEETIWAALKHYLESQSGGTVG
jgi:hypothetical protein